MNIPTYPRIGTNTSRYLARFIMGEKLKHRDADKAAGSYRLSGYVHYLKTKHHWLFESRDFLDDTLDPIGRTAPFTEYWFHSDAISKAGDEGIAYAERVLGWEQSRKAARDEALSAKGKPAQRICPTCSHFSTLFSGGG